MMDLFISSIWVLFLLVMIVAVCALFTNGIEWTGHRFNLSEGAVGSVLAAVGTALPETMVPLIAIFSGMMAGSNVSMESAHDIGIGAILGAPFLLSTLAMHVTAVALFYFSARKKRDLKMKLDMHLFRRDFHYFFAAYGILFLAAFIDNQPVKYTIGVGLLVFYGIYVYRTLKKEHVPDSEFHLPPLFFAPRKREPATWIIIGEVVFSLAALLVLVHFFVEEINHLATRLAINPMILSLIIAPIATELPEKFNSVVWISQRKDNMALGNITGAMVFQSCIPGTVGLLLTPWVLNLQGQISVVLCLLSAFCIYLVAWKKPAKLPQMLATSGVFYFVFITYTLLMLNR